MQSGANKFTVHTRLAALEAECTALRAECKELRVHLKGALQTAINDARRGFTEAAVGPPGPQGAKGERGDSTVPNDSEVAAALLEIRQKHAHALARIADAVEKNYGRKHSGIRNVLAAELALLERDLR